MRGRYVELGGCYAYKRFVDEGRRVAIEWKGEVDGGVRRGRWGLWLIGGGGRVRSKVWPVRRTEGTRDTV